MKKIRQKMDLLVMDITEIVLRAIGGDNGDFVHTPK